jgi:hypothetical protein
MTHDVNTTTADIICYLAFEGGQYKVISDTQKTSSGTQQNTGVGFQPIGMMTVGIGNTASSSIVSADPAMRISVGGSDGSNHRAMWMNDDDLAASSLTASHYSATKSIGHRTAAATGTSSTTEAEAHVSQFLSNGYELNWTTADGTSREFWSFCFGETPVSAGKFPSKTMHKVNRPVSSKSRAVVG